MQPTQSVLLAAYLKFSPWQVFIATSTELTTVRGSGRNVLLEQRNFGRGQASPECLCPFGKPVEPRRPPAGGDWAAGPALAARNEGCVGEVQPPGATAEARRSARSGRATVRSGNLLGNVERLAIVPGHPIARLRCELFGASLQRDEIVERIGA